MFRQLVGLVLLSLAAFGLSPAQADQAYLYQGPTQIEIFEVEVSADGSRADTLQPTLDPSVSGVQSAERTYYTIRVNALTNGSVDNIDVVAVCLYSMGSITGEPGDSSNCGYTDAVDRTTLQAERDTMLTGPTTPDPAHILSMKWDPINQFEIHDGAGNAHTLGAARAEATAATYRTIAAGVDATFTIQRLHFNFALSHAAVNTTDWALRVVSISQAEAQGSETAPTDRVEQTLLDFKGNLGAGASCSNEYSVDGQLFDGCAPNGNNYDLFGVNFFGGFFQDETRPSVDYGVISEASSSASQVSIRTGRYFANDKVSMTIQGSDFTHTNGQGQDVLGLVESFPVVAGTKGVALNCLGATDASGHDISTQSDPANYTTSIVVRNTAQLLFGDLGPSSGVGDSETSKWAPNHECKLYYGSGATYGNEVYTNTITLGLFDADTNTGPSATGVYQEIAVTATPTTTVTERNTNPVP